MSKPIVDIENWAVVRRGAFAAFQELKPGNVLIGKVFGHDRLPDAKSIYTSPIVDIDMDNCIVETRNTRYRLGEANPDYKDTEEYKSWQRERESQAA